MSIIIDVSITTKIAKMRQRVQWHHPVICARNIDQTALFLDDGLNDGQSGDSAFSFLVIGDSGSGPHTDHHPQRRIAEQMVPHLDDCRFLLHTGDVVYQVGGPEQYPQNFIHPYREWLQGGVGDPMHCTYHLPSIAYDNMVFKHPFLPVLGNHDYYNLPKLYSIFVKLMLPVKRLLSRSLPTELGSTNLGTRGSNTGDTYARAFMDYLRGFASDDVLAHHLDQHYTAQSDWGQCLRYQPGRFTRLPNRYYTFRYGGVDFFALDSSTFNEPSLLSEELKFEDKRPELALKRRTVEQEMQQVYQEAAGLDANNPQHLARLYDLQAKIEQMEEIQLDIQKQLTVSASQQVDIDQLQWLQQRLIDSWTNPQVRGRVIYFHHPPYVTENTKWHQAQTLAVRHHLRWALDGVAAALARREGDRAPAQPLVDLVVSGHAHCFEHLQTGDTGHADSHLDWIICGGSGFSLRRQWESDGDEIEETEHTANGVQGRIVAKSKLYVGLSGHRTERKRPYSFLRVDVQPGTPPRFVLRPYISERYHGQWKDFALQPFTIGL